MTTNDTTSQFFDGYARDFDAIYGNANTRLNALVNRFLRKSMRLRFDRSIDGCDPVKGKSIIDIGCGPGHYGLTLAKRGASRVHGIDFAKGMIDIAKARADKGGVGDVCTFEYGDFMTAKLDATFDHAIVMGFMDYMSDPRAVIERVLSLTKGSAFFSFPADGGVLAWQRKLRYKRRCDLFMYSKPQIDRLFAGTRAKRVNVDKIARDFFVTAHVG